MDKRILTVALAALLAACGGGNAGEGEAPADSVPAGATIEGTGAPTGQTAPMSADSAANMGGADMPGAAAPATDTMTAGTMTPPAMGTDSAPKQ